MNFGSTTYSEREQIHYTAQFSPVYILCKASNFMRQERIQCAVQWRWGE